MRIVNPDGTIVTTPPRASESPVAARRARGRVGEAKAKAQERLAAPPVAIVGTADGFDERRAPPPLPLEPQPPLPAGDDKREAARSVAEKVQQFRLLTRGYSPVEIAKHLGRTPSAVRNSMTEISQQFVYEALQEYRAAALLELGVLKSELERIMRDPGPLVSAKGIVYDANGEPYQDKQVTVIAAREIRGVWQDIRRLLGLDAPTRTHITLTEEETDKQLKQAINDMFGAQEEKIADKDRQIAELVTALADASGAARSAKNGHEIRGRIDDGSASSPA